MHLLTPTIENQIFNTLSAHEKVVDRNGNIYLNIPISFDIETTSFTDTTGVKSALPYLWQMDIAGVVIYGRHISEWVAFMRRLQVALEKREYNIICYVHNLAFEFQFIRKYFEWDNVFARRAYKPFKARTGNITFKCSYVLSGKALRNVAEDLLTYKIEKLPDFNYLIKRTPLTPLTDRELQYAANDVIILEYFIREEIARNNNSILEIPLTQTSYARRACRQACYDFKIRPKESRRLQQYITSLTIADAENYELLKRAYSGGYTHAALARTGIKIPNVYSRDEASAYPTVMVTEMFPASAGVNLGDVSRETALAYMKTHCCVFDVTLRDLEAKDTIGDFYLSDSKNKYRQNQRKEAADKDVIWNGRIIHAACVITTITEVDYAIIKRCYDFPEDRVDFHRFTIYERDYLPKPIVETVLQLYNDKTQLKKVPGKEAEYMHAKQLLNSLYGMMVTDIASPEILYTNEWIVNEANVPESITDYNSQKMRFLYYPWGVYVTAYARRNLFLAIEELGDDYIYSDTDSVKYTNEEAHKEFFERYNWLIHIKSQRVAEYYDMDPELWAPEDKFHVKHPLGYFESEPGYDYFKTLGAKRYLVQQGDKYQMTCAGVKKYPKSDDDVCGTDYLLTKGEPFEAFDDTLAIPPKYSGKNILTYIDEPRSGVLTDVNGIPYSYHVPSGVHMESATYHLSMPEEFLHLVHGGCWLSEDFC